LTDKVKSGGGASGRPDYGQLSGFKQPSLRKAMWQMSNTCIPYVALWSLMVLMLKRGYPYWITLALAIVAAAFLVRIFIFFHDCTHGSFFASQRANRILGRILGLLTFTPFQEWRYLHLSHHATAGDLDRRGKGDIWTMTVNEYRAAPLYKRMGYRIFRNPLVIFGLGPALIFIFSMRFSHRGARKKERLDVLFTNLILAAVIALASLLIGLRPYLMIQLPVIFVAGTIGIWLFYVQHQFEGVYWASHDSWDPKRAAMEGSSYYKLPRIMQWFTGNIGLHHIHHDQPRIPNYNLQRCYDEIPALQEVKPLTILRSLESPKLKLWDEKLNKMVGFRALKALPQESGSLSAPDRV